MLAGDMFALSFIASLSLGVSCTCVFFLIVINKQYQALREEIKTVGKLGYDMAVHIATLEKSLKDCETKISVLASEMQNIEWYDADQQSMM